MGVIKQGILGGFSGRVAGVVGSSWKGIAYMKALPLSVANPKTAAQVAQRTSFSVTVAIAVQILSAFIKIFWDRFAVHMSGFNAFVQANIKLYDSSLDNPYKNFVMSRGKMAATPIATAEVLADDTAFTVTWANDSGSGLKLASDVPFCVYVSKEGNCFSGEEGGVTRADSTTTLDFPDGFDVGTVGYIWLAFKRSDGTVVSDSTVKIATNL